MAEYDKHSIDFYNGETGENKNTWFSWNMIPADSLVISPPPIKSSSLEVPGADGKIDLTTALANRTLFDNRTGSWKFYIIKNQTAEKFVSLDWPQVYSEICNFIHGKELQITFQDDPEYYYKGRFTVSDFGSNGHYHTITIDYDVEPYKILKNGEYDSGSITVSTSKSLTVEGSPMPVIPNIYTKSNDYLFRPSESLKRGLAVELLYNLAAYIGGSKTAPTKETTFVDVTSDKSYYTAVSWAQEKGYISGYSDNIFAPENNITRAQFLTIAYNIIGKPSASGNTPFTDVPTSSYYYNAVRYFYLHNFISGTDSTTFSPNKNITREDAALTVWLMSGKKTPSTISKNVIDMPDDSIEVPWWFRAVDYCHNQGYVSGYSDGYYRPGNYITRGAFIQMIYAFCGKPASDSRIWEWTDDGTFTDVPTTLYCHDAVYWAKEYGIVSGTSSTTFSPGNVLQRSHAMAILYNFAQIYSTVVNTDLKPFEYDGQEDSDDGSMNGYEPASDVDSTSYYYHAVCWGIINEITTLDAGYCFYPTNKCTRGMAAVFIWKLAIACGEEGTYNLDDVPFTDVKCVSKYYKSAANFVVGYDGLSDINPQGLTIAITNEDDDGAVSAVQYELDSGWSTPPELTIYDGETDLTVIGNGTFRIIYSKGSL